MKYPPQIGPFLNQIPFPGSGSTIPTPTISTGPTFTDDGDGTGSFALTTDISTYAGVDYGVSSGAYTYSAFDYSGAGPALELATSHTIPVPDAMAGGTNFGSWYYRIWLGTPAGFSGYVGAESTFAIAPVLSSATDGTPTATGADDATVDTNCGSGTLYYALVTNGGSCTNAQLIAGTGGNIVAGTSGNQAVSATGTQTFDISGAAASTTYQIKTLHVVQGAESNQGSVSLTTAAAAGYALVQTPGSPGTGSTSSINYSLPSNPTSGNLVVVFAKMSPSQTMTISDNFGDGVAWGAAVVSAEFGAANAKLYMWAKVVGSCTGKQVTVGGNTFGDPMICTAGEWSGNNASPNDGANGQGAFGQNPSPGSALTTTANGLMLGFVANLDDAPTANGAYTSIFTYAGDVPRNFAIEHNLAATTGSNLADWTSPNSKNYVALQAAFKV